jgi:hypothetical protein
VKKKMKKGETFPFTKASGWLYLGGVMKTQNTTNNETVTLIAELMAGWNTIEARAKKKFPRANAEELYEICKGAMDHALGR